MDNLTNFDFNRNTELFLSTIHDLDEKCVASLLNIRALYLSEFGYVPKTIMELYGLELWNTNTGYNQKVYKRKRARLEKSKEKAIQLEASIIQNNQIPVIELETKIGKYLQIKTKERTVIGKLISVTPLEIVLEMKKGKYIISKSNFSVISSIKSGHTFNKLLYKKMNINIVHEKNTIQLLESQLEQFKNTDIRSKYISKYGSIKGLGFLENSAELFIAQIDFIPDNLFTLCYETVFSICLDKERVLELSNYIYEIITKNMLWLIEANNDEPLNDFLSENLIYKVREICYYVNSQSDYILENKEIDYSLFKNM